MQRRRAIIIVAAQNPHRYAREDPINADDHIGSYNPIPLEFPIRVAELRDIAAVYFAASLIPYKVKIIDDLRVSGDDGTNKTYRIPTAVKEKTAVLLPVMYKSLEEWKDYHFKTVYWDLGSSADLRDTEWLDEIVWMADGSINYGQTAKRMLHCKKMIALKKYRLACTYCFEDSVRSLRSTLGDERVKRDLRQDDGIRNPLLSYWDTVLTTTRWRESSNLEERIFPSVLKDRNFYAVQYLLDRLCKMKRIHKQNVFGYLYNPLYMWRILISLNAIEFDMAVKRYSRSFLQCFASEPQFEEVALIIWRYMVDRIADDERLTDILMDTRDQLLLSGKEPMMHLIRQMLDDSRESTRIFFRRRWLDDFSKNL